MLKPLLILSTLLLFGLSAFPQQDQAPAKPESPATESIPVDAKRKTNPVKPTAESIARGKKLYGYDCAMCHGKDGYGKGDVAEDMKLKIADFSNPEALREKPTETSSISSKMARARCRRKEIGATQTDSGILSTTSVHSRVRKLPPKRPLRLRLQAIRSSQRSMRMP
jgi:cytochrome c553